MHIYYSFMVSFRYGIMVSFRYYGISVLWYHFMDFVSSTRVNQLSMCFLELAVSKILLLL